MSTETEPEIGDMIQLFQMREPTGDINRILDILDRMHRLDLEMNAKLQEFAKTVQALKPK